MDFLEFVKKAKTAFHAAHEIKNHLLTLGFTELSESEPWNIEKGNKYFFTRNGSAVMAFTVPKKLKEVSYNIVASHLDSPTLKLKPNFTIDTGKYLKLNTEVYGGPILNTFMDRPLDIAGRVIVKTEKGLEAKLLAFNRAMAVIPNCSIHYYPELNKGVALNPAVDLVPIYADLGVDKADLLEMMSKELSVYKEAIISYDLYLSLIDRGTYAGANNEFIMAPQIDNLGCAFTSLEAFTRANNGESINVYAAFDNEEIGSRTRQGAASTMLSDLLERISDKLSLTKEEHLMALANSFIVSADNAQGFHPNYPQKFDVTNSVFLNKGIVIKNAARGSYTTDGLSLAYFIEVCKNASAKYQLNSNKSDIPGGGTLGAISLGNVSIHSVDIGLPQIAMHSAYETAGTRDFNEMVKALTQFYQMHLVVDKDQSLKF